MASEAVQTNNESAGPQEDRLVTTSRPPWTATLTESFVFSVPTRVTFGVGCRRELRGLLDRHAWMHVGVLADAQLQDVPGVVDVLAEIRAGGRTVRVVWSPPGEPTYDTLTDLRPHFADGNLDVVVGIGGGSALDTAKAMAVLVHNRRPALEYRGFERFDGPVLPIVALPTTAGTGSEITPNASFVDRAALRKMGINGEAVRPRYALLDPELTMSCPVGPTISAALDSMVHATEALVARKSTPIARALAREGFGRVFNNLPKVVDAPGDIAARSEVMYGAFVSGMALMHSGTGPAAAMSYPLGVHHGVAHGLAGALCLPAVVAINLSRGVSIYAELHDTIDGHDPRLARPEKAAAFLDRITSAWARLGVATPFRPGQMTAEGIETLVRDTLELTGALEQNPVPFTDTDIRRVFGQVCQTQL